MIIEIDQSGKVEETAKDTVIAFADRNDFKRSLKINAREKRKLQKFFREIGRARFYTYKVFAVLIFILIKDYLRKLDRVIIDPEYPGHEDLIRNLLLQLVQKVNRKFERQTITFKQIGKRSEAHKKAYATFRGKQKPNRIITAKDVLKIIVK